jgi:transitional endoplasmic reticulum ATPase
MRDINRSRIKIEKKELDALLIKLYKKEKNSSSNSFKKELTELKNIFQLCEEDIKILCFQYCYEVNSCFESFCDEYSFPEYLRLISVVEDISLSQLKKTLSKKEKLSMAGLAEISDTKRPGYIDLDDDIQEYLGGIADVPLAEKYWKEIKKSNFNLKTFNVPEQGKNIIKALLEAEGGCNILLYGDEGTGKTEFVKSICKACNKKIYFVQHGDDGDVIDRKKALIASAGTVPLDEAVLVFDEADSFLNNENMFFTSKKTIEKGWLNTFLDESGAKIIWITNNISRMERSIKRRFSYSWNFKRFTKKELKNVWFEHLKNTPLKKYITAEMIDEFSLQFRVNAAGIASALETVEKTIDLNTTDKHEINSVIKNLLTRHLELSGHKIKKPLNSLTERYDISALNIDVDTDVILGSLKKFAESSVDEDAENEGENINLLLWGRPGTGKTEFAKYVSSATGMDLVVKRGSDLLNPYVGMTEQYIAEAFDEAQRQKAILFIDEADSFFTARESANRSWEVTQTNELLTQMENFNGILICCTNFLNNLDKAAMRRFNWKVEFKSLTKDAKLTLYNKYFNIQDHLTKAQQQKIMRIPDLTPGDYKSVWQKYRFADKISLSHDEIISVVEKEVQYKHPEKAVNIGF